VPILAGGVVGVGQRAEIEEAPLLGALAGGNRHRAGYAPEQHRNAFISHLVDVGDGLVRARGSVSADQLQRATQHAAGLVDLVDGQQRTAHLRQAFFLVASGTGIVETKRDGVGCLSRKTEPQP